MQIDVKKIAKKLDEAGVPAAVREQTIASVMETLQLNVAMRLEEALNNNELEVFQKYAEGKDPSAAIAWFTKRFPDYEHVVDDELNKIINAMQASVAGIKKAAQYSK